jgi:MFS family permease
MPTNLRLPAFRDHPIAALAVICLSVFAISVDTTIVNVALPTLSRELNADTSQLQWIVDAYTLVMAGLLLSVGSLSDRFGRRGWLSGGLAVFAVTSAVAAQMNSAEALIAARAAMGVGAAVIFPTTLGLITNIFTDAVPRAKAIGVWAAMVGVGVAAGPMTGGWLLEHFSWGSIFLVNVPVAATAIAGGILFVPTSRDPAAPKVDMPGLILSCIGGLQHRHHCSRRLRALGAAQFTPDARRLGVREPAILRRKPGSDRRLPHPVRLHLRHHPVFSIRQELQRIRDRCAATARRRLDRRR